MSLILVEGDKPVLDSGGLTVKSQYVALRRLSKGCRAPSWAKSEWGLALSRLALVLGLSTIIATSSAIAQITQIIDASGDGMGNSVANALGIAVDSAGNTYVTTWGAGSDAFRITPGGTITQIIDSTGKMDSRSPLEASSRRSLTIPVMVRTVLEVRIGRASRFMGSMSTWPDMGRRTHSRSPG